MLRVSAEVVKVARAASIDAISCCDTCFVSKGHHRQFRARFAYLLGLPRHVVDFGPEVLAKVMLDLMKLLEALA